MKLFFDFFPIILFFAAYKLSGIYAATIVAIVASLIQVAWSRYQKGHFEKLQVLTLAVLVVMGGATLLFGNELFIKWKPTILYWALSVLFLGSQFIGSTPLYQRLLGEQVSLSDRAWIRLNLSWSIFFGLMGFANLYVLYNFDTDTWVSFKLFGTLGMTIVFAIIQGIYISRNSQT